MSDRFDIYGVVQLEAMAGKLTKSEIMFENKVRRWYSGKFSTPLHDTFKLSWVFLLRHYYEDQVDSADYNTILDLVTREYLPDFTSQFEQENIEFAKSLEEEQERTLQEKENSEPEVLEEEQPKLPEIKEYNLTFDPEDDL